MSPRAEDSHTFSSPRAPVNGPEAHSWVSEGPSNSKGGEPSSGCSLLLTTVLSLKVQDCLRKGVTSESSLDTSHLRERRQPANALGELRRVEDDACRRASAGSLCFSPVVLCSPGVQWPRLLLGLSSSSSRGSHGPPERSRRRVHLCPTLHSGGP